MSKLFFISLAMLIAFHSMSQTTEILTAAKDEGYSSGTISVTAIGPLSYTYASEQDLLQPKLLLKSIRIDLAVKQKSSVISGQIFFFNGTSAAIQDKFSIKLSQTNSPNASSPSDFVRLSSAPVLLFAQPGTSRGAKSYSYYFDIKLDPPTDFQTNPVSFYYILFTLSSQ